MLLTVIKKELLEHLRSFRFIVITAVSLLLAFTSILVMYSNYQSRMENHAALLPSIGPNAALLQPAQMSILVKGMDEAMCQQVRIEQAHVATTGTGEAHNILFKLFTAPDLYYIVKVVLSLCAILLAFNLVSGEKEARTLALVISNSVSRSKLLIGKWISGLACLLTPFVIAILIAAIVFNQSPDIQMDAQNWLKLAMVLVSSVLYLAFFFTLGLLVSCINARSSSALVISLFLWVLLVFVIPGLGGLAASRLANTQSEQTLRIRHQMAWIARQQQGIEENGGYLAILDFPEVDKLLADYRARFERQLTLSKAITRISPTAVYTLLATDFAGTGALERLRYKQAILSYRLVMKQSGDNGGENPAAFTYKRSPVAEILAGDGLVNLLVILLQNLVVFAAAYVLFLRYDVR